LIIRNGNIITRSSLTKKTAHFLRGLVIHPNLPDTSSHKPLGNVISTFKLITLNIQRILSKQTSFDVLLNEYNPDIVAVSETSLSSDILTHELFPEGYHIFRKDRADGYSEVLLAFRETISC